jgi:hypothetical protein
LGHANVLSLIAKHTDGLPHFLEEGRYDLKMVMRPQTGALSYCELLRLRVGAGSSAESFIQGTWALAGSWLVIRRKNCGRV